MVTTFILKLTCAYNCIDIPLKFFGRFSMNSYYNGYVLTYFFISLISS